MSTVLYLASIINIPLGGLVLYRNRSHRANIYFFVFTVSVTAWTVFIGLFLDATDHNAALLYSKLYYLFALIIAFAIYKFALNYNTKTKRSNQNIVLNALIITISVATLFIDNFIVKEINFGSQNTADLNNLGYTIYSAAFIGLYVMTVRALTKKMNTAQLVQKTHLAFIFYSIALSMLFGMIFNLFLPWFGNYTLIWLGPLFAILYVSLLTYAIIRHRLFDIRLIIARSVAYLLLLLALATIYGLIIFGVTNLFFNSEEVDSVSQGVQVLYVVSAIFLAFTFQPLKKFFDRVTNSIFYRDGYDTQEKLKTLSEILAEEIDIETISKRVIKLLSSTLKASQVELLVLDGEELFFRESSTVNTKKPPLKDLVSLKDNVTLYDEADSNKQMLRNYSAEVVSRITSQGELVGFIVLGQKASGSIYTNQDIELLTICSKELAIALENAKNYSEIQAFNETLKKEVKTATTSLRDKNAKLRELDQAKDDFISMASHQLRTPLTTIKGYLSMLDAGDFGKLTKKQQGITKLAYTSSERMVYLIADLLNVSRIDTGKFVIERTEVNLAKMVHEEVEQLQRSAKAKGIKLTLNIPKKFPVLMLDETKTRQVVMNMIDNALYYTPKGEVAVELSKSKDSVSFTVKDSGIGVPESARAELFTKFYRAENARKARPDGTGLGLFMAKKVISSQGGSIIFKTKEGKGSTFGFRFSLATVLAKK